MRIFYHDVGLQGSSRDFPRTVFSRVPISRATDALGQDHPLIVELHNRFPTGDFNSWGVPSGARHVIRSLTEGDCVILVANRVEEGEIPALGLVKLYWNRELPALSRALWGEERFPYVFFFETVRLDLTWTAFRESLNYGARFNPRGSFNSISDSKLTGYGGAGGYIAFLQKQHGSRAEGNPYPIRRSGLKKVLGEQKAEYLISVEQELQSIQKKALYDPPSLTDNRSPVVQTTTVPPRSAAFRAGVIQEYAYRCAVCGNGAQSPTGRSAVESAHLYPKRLNGSDDIRNGVCLCRMHHWALDSGWLSFSDDLVVLVRADLPEGPDYDFIRHFQGTMIASPTQPELRPHPLFLKAHRQLHGFELL